MLLCWAGILICISLLVCFDSSAEVSSLNVVDLNRPDACFHLVSSLTVFPWRFSSHSIARTEPAWRTTFDVKPSAEEAMEVKERRPYRSLTARQDGERRYTSSSADSEDGKANPKSYSSSETLKAFDHDSRMAYGSRVKEMVHHEVDEFSRQGQPHVAPCAYYKQQRLLLIQLFVYNHISTLDIQILLISLLRARPQHTHQSSDTLSAGSFTGALCLLFYHRGGLFPPRPRLRRRPSVPRGLVQDRPGAAAPRLLRQRGLGCGHGDGWRHVAGARGQIMGPRQHQVGPQLVSLQQGQLQPDAH